jgi:hypothetical protein
MPESNSMFFAVAGACAAAIDRIMEIINHFAFTQVAIYGYSFVKAGKVRPGLVRLACLAVPRPPFKNWRKCIAVASMFGCPLHCASYHPHTAEFLSMCIEQECWTLIQDVGLMPLLNNFLVQAVGWLGALAGGSLCAVISPTRANQSPPVFTCHCLHLDLSWRMVAHICRALLLSRGTAAWCRWAA